MRRLYKFCLRSISSAIVGMSFLLLAEVPELQIHITRHTKLPNPNVLFGKLDCRICWTILNGEKKAKILYFIPWSLSKSTACQTWYKIHIKTDNHAKMYICLTTVYLVRNSKMGWEQRIGERSPLAIRRMSAFEVISSINWRASANLSQDAWPSGVEREESLAIVIRNEDSVNSDGRNSQWFVNCLRIKVYTRNRTFLYAGFIVCVDNILF